MKLKPLKFNEFIELDPDYPEGNTFEILEETKEDDKEHRAQVFDPSSSMILSSQ